MRSGRFGEARGLRGLERVTWPRLCGKFPAFSMLAFWPKALAASVRQQDTTAERVDETPVKNQNRIRGRDAGHIIRKFPPCVSVSSSVKDREQAPGYVFPLLSVVQWPRGRPRTRHSQSPSAAEGTGFSTGRESKPDAAPRAPPCLCFPLALRPPHTPDLSVGSPRAILPYTTGCPTF